MKKKKFVYIAIIAVLLIIGAISFSSFRHTEKIQSYITGKKVSATLDLVNSQVAINKKLEKIATQKKYTFNDAYVELNPYKISPLSAIIIFNTPKEESISLTINDVYVTTFKASLTHIIPIYGLKEDFENSVKLVMGEEEKIYTIKTKKSNIEYPLNVEYKSQNLNNEELYFTVASYSTYLTAWDIEGNLRFYLTVDNRMDVEWLDNGHFLIGTTQDQAREQFMGFVEMDYLGKIYNYYTLEHGYSFEFQTLTNGNYMLAGGNEAIYMDEQYIYELNPQDGTTVSEINLSQIIKEIDPEFNAKYLGAGAIRNGFNYNELTGELVVSFRELNTIFSFNYPEKKLNWVFVDPSNEAFQNPVWDKYKVKSTTGRYPLGQHTPTITKEGYLAFFNNGYDRYHVSEGTASDKIGDYKNAYSSVEIVSIKNNIARPIWHYDNNKDLFSIKYGLFNILENNHKLMNFGYIIKDEYRANYDSSVKETENGIDNVYALILEMDNYNNIIFKATCEEGKFRVFKHSLYANETDYTDPSILNIFNSIPDDNLEKVSVDDIDLSEPLEWIFSLDMTKNTFTTNYEITETDALDIYFVNKKGEVYILNYKDKENQKPKRIFNANLAQGEYGIYINLNGKVYNPKVTLVY